MTVRTAPAARARWRPGETRLAAAGAARVGAVRSCRLAPAGAGLAGAGPAGVGPWRPGSRGRLPRRWGLGGPVAGNGERCGGARRRRVAGPATWAGPVDIWSVGRREVVGRGVLGRQEIRGGAGLSMAECSGATA